ncbi:MAG: hypothetical protein JWN76_711 [Chitinophagaceae bacterium]|nr:hypothetical protein [Chitinophagaceae bacterium]
MGPFTLEELVASGLKLYDLVWVDGKSAAWRYPSEINELKAHAPGSEEHPFEQFFKPTKETGKVTAAEKLLSPGKTVQTETKPKPRFKVTAVSNKIEPENKTTTKSSVDADPAHYNYLPRLTATQTKEFYEVKPPVVPVAALETKYQRSLEDIKQEYTATILAGKTKKKDYRYAWLAIVPVFAVGIVLGISFTKKSPGKELAVIPHVIKNASPVTNATNVLTSEIVSKQEEIKPETKKEKLIQQEEIKPEPKTEIEKPAKILQQKPLVTPKIKKEKLDTKQENKEIKKAENKVLVTSSKKEREKTLPVVVPKKVQTVPEKKQPGFNPEIVLTRPTGNETGRTAKVNMNRIKDQEQKQQSAEERTPDKKITASAPAAKTSKKSMDDFVIVDGNYNRPAGGIKDITLNVQNITSYPLDMVVVDVEYFDRNGRLLKGETLYVHDLQPRQNVTVNAPDGNATAKLGYKVSMVSSQRAGVHLIAD